MYSYATWHERYRNRYQWAVRAYDRFMHELAPELVDSLQRNDRITVVVYGATQVGKTTLILDLLGLDTRTSEEVGMVLRGGQQLGKSATAMPIRYGRSPDDAWYVAGTGPLTPEAACERLGQFRREVESGGIRDAEVLDIRIPGRLFPVGDGQSLSLELNIIDIPGINSRNEDERLLVANLARRYVLAADLVLLVGRADSLGFLNEADLQIEALAAWAAQPARFRIVLTFAFSPDSLYQQFRDGELTCERVRDVMIAEMATHDYGFPPEFRANLFLLELGDSVQALGRSNPDYCERIQQVTQDFRHELLDNIARSAGPYARLYGAFQLDLVIWARIERLRRQLHVQEAALDECRPGTVAVLAEFCPYLAGKPLDDIEQSARQHRAELAGLVAQLEQLQVCRRRLQAHDCVRMFKYEIDHGPKLVRGLEQQLQAGEQAQRTACMKVADQLVQDGVLQGMNELNVPVLGYQRGPLMWIESRLDGYSLDSYWSSSNFRSDRSSVQQALDTAAREHGGRLRSMLSRSLLEHERHLQAESDDLASRCRLMDASVDRLQALEHERQELQQQYAHDLQRMEASRELASHFESRVNAAFLQELRATREAARNHPDVKQRFYGLLHARMLLGEIDKMYQGRTF